MKRARKVGMCILCATFSWVIVSLAIAGTPSKAAVQAYEGQIQSIKVEKCGLQPGSCQGSVILAQAGGKGEVTLAVRPGTWLKRGDQLVTIDELGVGNYVKLEATRLPDLDLPQITILSRED
jgi:hypothetical protein